MRINGYLGGKRSGKWCKESRYESNIYLANYTRLEFIIDI